MPGIYRDEVVVLRSIKLGEADRIVTLYGRDHGKIRAVAKGVRKTKSRFGGRLEPFTRLAVMLYRGKGDLDTITSADVAEANAGLRREYASLAAAAALAELVERITPDRERSLQTYSLLTSGLRALAELRAPSIVPAFLLKLLSVSGYHPQLRACAGCGNSRLLGGFSSSLGGAVCEDCWSEDQAAVGLGPERIGLMARLLMDDFGVPAGDEEVRDVIHVLRSYAEYHLERPLRSFEMLYPATA
jgi:DNA repair protein RecO (recombination protein O)